MTGDTSIHCDKSDNYRDTFATLCENTGEYADTSKLSDQFEVRIYNSRLIQSLLD